MNLQQLITNLGFDLSVSQVKAFFLGALCAKNPMPFSKAMIELLDGPLDNQQEFETELKKYWEHLAQNKNSELKNMFDESKKGSEFLTEAKDQVDYFLTSLALAGTHSDSADEKMADALEDLEDLIEDMEDVLSEGELDAEEMNELKNELKEIWKDFLKNLESPSK